MCSLPCSKVCVAYLTAKSVMCNLSYSKVYNVYLTLLQSMLCVAYLEAKYEYIMCSFPCSKVYYV